MSHTASVGAGRYAPSPSGDLHLGNLRTALWAHLFAGSTGRLLRMRMEDLDRVKPKAAERQLADLADLGVRWQGVVLYQSTRTQAYQQAIAKLTAQGATYECYCTRREIQQAASAPHGPPGAYPGICRELTDTQRRQRRRARPPAIRLRAEVSEYTALDVLHGSVTAAVDDVVLRRSDGVAAYNLAVVIDDAHQGIDQVVRGDDLLTSAPRQAYLARLLGLAVPSYAHVPLVLGPTGARLAKRDGAVTLAELRAGGWSTEKVRNVLAVSMGLAAPGEQVSMTDLAARFDPVTMPRDPWQVDPAELTGHNVLS